MKLPKFIWADYDPTMPRNSKWAFYPTRAEQRANRRDLQPIKLRVQLAAPRKTKRTS